MLNRVAENHNNALGTWDMANSESQPHSLDRMLSTYIHTKCLARCCLFLDSFQEVSVLLCFRFEHNSFVSIFR